MEYFLWSEASKARNQLTERYEPIQPYLFLSFLEFSGADVVLDVGANVGLYSLVSTIASKVKFVYAFEPDDAAYTELLNNIRVNSLEDIIKPYQVAVSDAEGKVCFGSHSPMSGVNGVIVTSIHDHAVFTEKRDVAAMMLDQLEDIKGKVLGIKIDVEGHELEVIKGALELLASSPAVIQVEHYVGSGIDEALNKLGYFSFFIAGQDHYFTNIRNFSHPLFVKRATEYAVSWLIETQSGRLPDVDTIKSSLLLLCDIADKIYVEASLKEGFFSEPEFAFYLMVNGEKTAEQWYQDGRKVSFELPTEADSIEIKAFVREKKLPDKKVVVGEFLKRPVFGYRAASAVSESLGLPSSYAALISRLAREESSFAELDTTSLLHDIAATTPSDVLLIGGGPTAKSIMEEIKEFQGRKLIIIATKEQIASIEKLEKQLYSGKLVNSSWLTVKAVEQPSEMVLALAAVSQELSATIFIVLMDQFLADIGYDIQVLDQLLKELPEKSKLYAEGLANASHRQKILDLANCYGVEVRWLYPLSTILISDKLVVDQQLAKTSNLPFSSLSPSNEDGFNSFYLLDGVSSEKALGLDFSLPEDRY